VEIQTGSPLQLQDGSNLDDQDYVATPTDGFLLLETGDSLLTENPVLRIAFEGTAGTNSAPVITLQPVAQVKYDEETVAFECTATDADPYDTVQYQWYEEQPTPTAMPGETSTILQFPVTLADNNRTFYMQVDDGHGNIVTSNSVVLTVVAIPVVFNPQPQDEEVSEATTAQFTVGYTGKTPITGVWHETTAGELTGETGNTYTIPVAGLGDDGNSYFFRVTDGYSNVVDSVTASLTVNPIQAGSPDLYYVLSGGVNNVTKTNSLGGPASTLLGGIPVSRTALLVSGGVSGTTVLGAIGGPTGTGTLSWVAGTSTMTWTGPEGYSEAHVVSSSGIYQFDAKDGRLYADIDFPSLSGSDETADYTLSLQAVGIMDDVQYQERAQEHYNYRCLYVRNNRPTTLANLTLEITPDPEFGEIAIGTEFRSAGISKLPDRDYIEHSALNFGGMQYYAAKAEAFAIDFKEYMFNGMFMAPAYSATVADQDSDGISVQVPAVLADELDSTNVLSGVLFSNRIFWPTIDPGKYASFWIRRHIPANSSGLNFEADKYGLRILYEDL
jgi:hypothetical protein